MTLDGMTALVTGASRGIGLAIAMTLGLKGATVYLTARNLEPLEGAAAEISKAGARAYALQMDVRDPAGIGRAVERILAESSPIDILVNNAGVRRDKLLVRLREEDWREVLEVNLSGAFYCIQKVVPAMSRARFGRIISIASVVGFTGNPGQANYAAAKAGVAGLTKSVAREYASRGITANAVAPGLVETEMLSGMEEKAYQQIVGQIPMGRPGRAEEVAEAVAFLASREAGYITGQVLHINGGLYV